MVAWCAWVPLETPSVALQHGMQAGTWVSKRDVAPCSFVAWCTSDKHPVFDHHAKHAYWMKTMLFVNRSCPGSSQQNVHLNGANFLVEQEGKGTTQGPEAPRNGMLPVHYLRKLGGNGNMGRAWSKIVLFLHSRLKNREIIGQNPPKCTFCC